MFKLLSVFALLVSATTLTHAQSVTPPTPQTLTTPVTDPRGQVIPHDVKKPVEQAEPEQAAPRKAGKAKHTKAKAAKTKTVKAKANKAKVKKTKSVKSSKKPAAAKRQHLDPAL